MVVLEETIIKSKQRVQKHGEVFTPNEIVNKMLNIPEIKTACENLTATFLEPAAGEGVFLVEILKRKLKMVSIKYNDDLNQFENYSLLALSTLYGIELLEDNAQTCVMNVFQLYYDIYQKQSKYHKGDIKTKVLDSAKTIISTNIREGDFLTKKTVDGKPLIFSEWTPTNMRKNTKNIKVQRTEYTLEEIYNEVEKESGQSVHNTNIKHHEQIDMFDLLEKSEDPEGSEVEKEKLHYLTVNIVNTYKEEMEETDG